jgi:phospholipid/cholesterol/gamma-HCH transport system permease protein
LSSLYPDQTDSKAMSYKPYCVMPDSTWFSTRNRVFLPTKYRIDSIYFLLAFGENGIEGKGGMVFPRVDGIFRGGGLFLNRLLESPVCTNRAQSKEKMPAPGKEKGTTMANRHVLTAPFDYLGRKAIFSINEMGAMALFFLKACLLCLRPNVRPLIVRHVYDIGARSATIVTLVGLFTGMVLGLQLFHTLSKFGSEGVLGAAVALSLIRELGPVLTAIMITARAGSSMAAEIGTQRITEQIDAIYTMRVDPIGYLISPRLAASIISFPLLTAFFDLIGILGGYLTGVALLGMNFGSYFYRVQASVDLADIRGGFIKSIVFAVLVSTVCCFQGYFTHMRKESYGARAVGLSTTSAVVMSCVLILVADYAVTSLLT